MRTLQTGPVDPTAWTKKARQASTNLYQHTDKGHWPGDCRVGNLHEGEGYLEIHRRSCWQIMLFASQSRSPVVGRGKNCKRFLLCTMLFLKVSKTIIQESRIFWTFSMLVGIHRYVCHCQNFSCNYFPLCHIWHRALGLLRQDKTRYNIMSILLSLV